MTQSDVRPLLVYNLFPRYFPAITDWHAGVRHAKELGFNAVFINPFHETGFSGSLYAVKDYFRLNPLFLPGAADQADLSPLRRFVAQSRGDGLDVIMDLVINHTAFDANLTREHPEWYKRDRKKRLVSPFAVDPADPKNVTVWGDLAEVKNRDASVQPALWKYWDAVVRFYQEAGFSGFRCDAAYKVPAGLWKMLIGNARERDSRVVFLAETLGCTLAQTQRLKSAGFDYLFNSVKWWNFDRPWCPQQHETFKKIAPSIGFAESHDTERLAAEQPGTIEMQKNRYLLSAIWSKGLLMPMGYEYGVKKRMDVVRGRPEDAAGGAWDLCGWVRGVNALKSARPLFMEEGAWKVLSTYDAGILVMRKDGAGGSCVVLVNKDWHCDRVVGRQEIATHLGVNTRMLRAFDEKTGETAVDEMIHLKPSEIVLFF